MAIQFPNEEAPGHRQSLSSGTSWWMEADDDGPIVEELWEMAALEQTAASAATGSDGSCGVWTLRRRRVQMLLRRTTSSRKYACCDLLTVLLSIALLFWAGIATLVDLQSGVSAAQAMRADKRAAAFVIVETTLLAMFVVDMLLRFGTSPKRFCCSCWTLYDVLVVIAFAVSFLIDRVGVLGYFVDQSKKWQSELHQDVTLALLSGILLVLRNSALVVRKLVSLANRFWRQNIAQKASNRIHFDSSVDVEGGGGYEDLLLEAGEQSFSEWNLPPAGSPDMYAARGAAIGGGYSDSATPPRG